MAEHLVPTETDRGFRWMPSLGNGRVQVYESSAAKSPHIWLSVDEEGESVLTHLDAETAWQLKEQLEWLLEHHYQGDARPTPSDHEPEDSQ